MMQTKNANRYYARPELKVVIDAQGRRHVWLARQLRISQGQLSKIIAGTKSIPEPEARLLAALLGWEFAMLFVLPLCKTLKHGQKEDAACPLTR